MMAGPVMVELDQRAVLRVGGADRVSFLQNLVSGDVGKVERGRAVWSALLTPQGKYLADFLLYPDGESILLDVETGAAEDLKRRLMLYRLRAKVTIDETGQKVWALLGDGAAELAGLPAEPGACAVVAGGIAAVDPRLAALGVRLLGTQAPAIAGAIPGTFSDWDRLRLRHGVPDGSRDLVAEKTTLLEAGFDELGGVDFAKGCYVGQELTARMKYRGLLKKRLLPVEVDGDAPSPGTPLLAQNGSEAGEMRSSCGALGLALIRRDALDGPLTTDGRPVRVHRPGWLPVA
jgi:folate-binding protein YgfZ